MVIFLRSIIIHLREIFFSKLHNVSSVFVLYTQFFYNLLQWNYRRHPQVALPTHRRYLQLSASHHSENRGSERGDDDGGGDGSAPGPLGTEKFHLRARGRRSRHDTVQHKR